MTIIIEGLEPKQQQVIEEVKQSKFDAIVLNVPKDERKCYKTARSILAALCDEYGTQLTLSECRDYLTEIWADEYSDEFNLDFDGMEFRIISDDALDRIWEEYLDDLLDDCYLHGLPDMVQNYFDREAWIRDAKMDGAGHALNGYDGGHIESKRHNIFRQN